MALAPGARVGRYEILAPIGAGGRGEVYRGRDDRLRRDVAIKILPAAFADHPERLARFEREARTLASLNDAHIAQVYGLERVHPNRPAMALVMELVPGDDLSERIARGAIPLDEALPIALQIVEALTVAHEHGIVHRDSKPANVKLGLRGASYRALLRRLAKEGTAGGRTYDAVIGECARRGRVQALLTFDSRHFDPPPPGVTIVEPGASD